MKITKTKTFATYGSTESGDDLPVLMWDRKPTDKQVDAAYRLLLPYEYDDVGSVHWIIDKLDKVAV